MTATYSVDNAPLDDPSGRWWVEAATDFAPAMSARSVSVSAPGFDGAIGRSREATDVPMLNLSIVVAGETTSDLNRNLNAIARLMRGALTATKTVDGSTVTAEVQWANSSKPEYWPDDTAKVVHVLRLPRVYWRGSLTDFTRTNPGMGDLVEVTTLSGSTGPVTDALLLITGPISNPRVLDGGTGEWVQVTTSVASGEKLLIDCVNWVARKGSGTSFSGGGSVISGALSYTRDSPNLFGLTPVMQGGDPADVSVFASLNGTGNTSATTLAIRARRSHLS